MGSKQWGDIGAERGAETGRMYPEKLTIVGLDISEEDLLARYPTDSRADENARAAIISCRDDKRCRPPPEWFTRQLAYGSPDAVEVYRLPPDCRGKLWVVVFQGRNRVMSTRDLNKACRRRAERQQLDIKLVALRPEKMTRGAALIALAGKNNHVEESLEVRAARALEMKEERLEAEVIVTMLARGGGQPVVDELLAWAEVFPLLSEGAVQLANAGKLRLARARKLALLRAEEQDAALSQQPKRRGAPDGPRPASPARLRALFAEVEGDSKIHGVHAGVRVLLRVLAGEASPEELSEGLFAAWNRAEERLRARGKVGVAE